MIHIINIEDTRQTRN